MTFVLRRALLASAAMSDNEISAMLAAGAITPVPGDEILTNPGFEGTYVDLSSGGGGTIDVAPYYTILAMVTTGADTADEQGTIKHGGAKSQYIKVANTVGAGLRTSAGVFSANAWYQVSAWFYGVAGSIYLRHRNMAAPAFIYTPPVGSWGQVLGTFLSTSGTTNQINVVANSAAAEFYLDDASVKLLSIATMSKLVGTRSAIPGVYTCHPTVAGDSQAGMLIRYLDENNFVLALVDRANLAADAGQARMLKCVGGVYTLLREGTITYVAGQSLSVTIDSSNNYQLAYNDVAVGAAVSVTDALGYEVRGFSTLATNAVGAVTTKKK